MRAFDGLFPTSLTNLVNYKYFLYILKYSVSHLIHKRNAYNGGNFFNCYLMFRHNEISLHDIFGHISTALTISEVYAQAEDG